MDWKIRSEKKFKKMVGVLCLSVMLGGVVGGCGSADQDQDEDQDKAVATVGVPVEVQPVIKEDYERIITIGGMTNAQATVNVIAKVNGLEQIQQVNYKVGDYVHKGAVLAVLNSDLSRIQLSNAQMAYDDALRNYEQNQVLFEAGAVSQYQMDQLEMMKKSAENNLAQAQLAQDYATVTATISGTVVSCNADEGSYASAQAPMFVLANIDELEIKSGLSESFVGKVEPGQSVKIMVDAIGDEPFKGKITEISKVMDMNSKSYPITIAIDNKQGKMMAGMYAKVEVVTDRVAQAITVPAQAIINRDGNRYVFVQEDGKASERLIQVGLSDGNNYVVVEGLQVEDQLITKGNRDLVDGQSVVVVNNSANQGDHDTDETEESGDQDLADQGASSETKRGDQ